MLQWTKLGLIWREFMAEPENQDEKANSENKKPELENGEQKLKREHPFYYAFVKESLPKVKNAIAVAKSRIVEMQKKIQETKAAFKKAYEAARANKNFSAKVYCMQMLQGIKVFAKQGVEIITTNYQDLKTALASGVKTVDKAIIGYKKANLPSRLLEVKSKEKGQNEEEKKEDKKKPETQEQGAKAKKKNVAENAAQAQVNQQKDRVVVRAVETKQKEQAMRLGDALRQQKKSSLEHEAALAIEQLVKIRTERAEKDQKLVKEQSVFKFTMEKNKEIQENQQKQMDALVKENRAQNVELNISKPKVAVESQQFDWSKKGKVIETKAQEKNLKKESEKVVEETKKAVNNSKKEALSRLKELSGRGGYVGALKNDFAKAGMNIDFSSLKPEYKVKIEQAQAQAREQVVAKEFTPKGENSFEFRPDYATEEFKKAWKEKDKQAQNSENNEKQDAKEEKPLTKAETMKLMRNGINPKLKNKKSKSKGKKGEEKTHNLTPPSKTIDMKIHRYLNGGKSVG